MDVAVVAVTVAVNVTVAVDGDKIVLVTDGWRYFVTTAMVSLYSVSAGDSGSSKNMFC